VFKNFKWENFQRVYKRAWSGQVNRNPQTMRKKFLLSNPQWSLKRRNAGERSKKISAAVREGKSDFWKRENKKKRGVTDKNLHAYDPHQVTRRTCVPIPLKKPWLVNHLETKMERTRERENGETRKQPQKKKPRKGRG